MYCDICKEHTNLTTKYPLILPCCGETICKQCKDKLINPQSTTFQCPISECGEQNRSDTKFLINKTLEKQLKQSIGIFCDKHLDKQADFYCPQDKTMVCANCAFTEYYSHKMIPVEKQAIINYNDLIIKKLNQEQSRISTLIQEPESYQLNARPFTNSQYMKLIEEAQEAFIYRMKTQQEKNSITFLGEQRPSTINLDSLLITTEDELQFLYESLGKPQCDLQLLYRGSKDGFGSVNFHSKCNNQGPTLTVVKSDKDKIFGGYASISWTSKGGYVQDWESFVFSLTNKKKLASCFQSGKIGDQKGYGPTFGGGHDFTISDNCNNSSLGNYSNLGTSYNPPDGIDQGSFAAKSYLAGAHYFKVEEIEVFKVI